MVRISSSAFPRVAKELDAAIELLVRDRVVSWYSDISSDPLFYLLIRDTLAQLTHRLEDAIRSMDLVRLCSNMSDIFSQHLRDFKIVRSKADSIYSGGKDIDTLFHFSQPHPALDSPEAEDEYLRNLSDVLIQRLLPPEDWSCDVLRYLLREILTKAIFGYMMKEFSKPDYIYSLICSLNAPVSDAEVVLDDSSTTYSPEQMSPELDAASDSSPQPDDPDATIPFQQEQKTFLLRKRKTHQSFVVGNSEPSPARNDSARGPLPGPAAGSTHSLNSNLGKGHSTTLLSSQEKLAIPNSSIWARIQAFWRWCTALPSPLELRYRHIYLDEPLFNLSRELLDGNYWAYTQVWFFLRPIAHALFGTLINRVIIQTVSPPSDTSSSGIDRAAAAIKAFHEHLANPAPSAADGLDEPPTYTFEDAVSALKSAAPFAVRKLIGETGVQDASEKFAAAFGSQFINKHLLFLSIDLIVKEMLEQV
ncbi:MAG: hypothetical protein SGCHY_000247 [Lobulomycetales sp.]